LLTALLATSCARTTRAPVAPVDLAAARAGVAAARESSSTVGLNAGVCVEVATRALSKAEDLAASQDQGNRDLAAWLATLASDAARGASECSRRADEQRGDPTTAERQAGELARAREAQRRLEERLAVLQRDLELTETELIRTKARLKGLQTKAEAAAAVAEAQILVRRVAKERGASATIVRCQDLLRRAEQQLREGNFGAAVFFAGRAQDLATGVRGEP
jgi:hypothetical protein